MESPTVDDVNDVEPVWLDPEQLSKYRAHVARCLLFQSGQSTNNIRRERVVPENVRSFATQLHQIEAARSVLHGRETMDPSV